MPRYVALLRGVSPMNARMPALRACFEGAGFTNVTTLLSSGNVVFDAPRRGDATLARQAEAAMAQTLGAASGPSSARNHNCERCWMPILSRPSSSRPARNGW